MKGKGRAQTSPKIPRLFNISQVWYRVWYSGWFSTIADGRQIMAMVAMSS